MVHFGCHLLNLLSLVLTHFLHFAIDHPFALLKLLIFSLQIDEALSQPVDVEVLVGLACLLRLARLYYFAELLISDHVLQKTREHFVALELSLARLQLVFLARY